MIILFKTVHIIAALFLVLVVLLQSGRGGGMGASLGGATSQIFGGRGANQFLTRVTTAAAVVFFSTSLTLSMISSHHRSVVRSHGPNPSAPIAPSDAGAPGANVDHIDPAAADEDHADAAAKPGAPEPTPMGVPAGKS